MSCSIFFFKKEKPRIEVHHILRSLNVGSEFKPDEQTDAPYQLGGPNRTHLGIGGCSALPSQSILLSGHVKSWRRSGNARKSDTLEKEGELTSEGSRVLRLPLCSPASCVGTGPFAGEFRLLCDGEGECRSPTSWAVLGRVMKTCGL